MALIFNQFVRHGRVEIPGAVPVGFEDKDAEPYFLKLGWAETTTKKPQRIYTQDEVSIDPETTDAATGARVLGEAE